RFVGQVGVLFLYAQDFFGRPDACVEDDVGDGRQVFAVLAEGREEAFLSVGRVLVEPPLAILPSRKIFQHGAAHQATGIIVDDSLADRHVEKLFEHVVVPPLERPRGLSLSSARPTTWQTHCRSYSHGDFVTMSRRRVSSQNQNTDSNSLEWCEER